MHALEVCFVACTVCSWTDRSYNYEKTWYASGADGTGGYCAGLWGYGALLFEANYDGSLHRKKMLSFAVQKGDDGNVPDAQLTLSSKEVIKVA
jgi:hypothetical protein